MKRVTKILLALVNIYKNNLLNQTNLTLFNTCKSNLNRTSSILVVLLQMSTSFLVGGALVLSASYIVRTILNVSPTIQNYFEYMEEAESCTLYVTQQLSAAIL